MSFSLWLDKSLHILAQFTKMKMKVEGAQKNKFQELINLLNIKGQ